LSQNPSPFCFSYFSDWVSHFLLARARMCVCGDGGARGEACTTILLLLPLIQLWITGIHLCLAWFLRWHLSNFLPRLAWTCDCPISASQITGKLFES
jgi:hypothetical protein